MLNGTSSDNLSKYCIDGGGSGGGNEGTDFLLLEDPLRNLSDTSDGIDPTIDFVFNGLGLLILCLLGVTANLLSIVVLTRLRYKSSLNTLLLGLTISDTVVISATFLIFSLPHFLKGDAFLWFPKIVWPHFLEWLLPIDLTVQMTSVYFTVVITLERYVAVCLPFQARSLCTRSTAKWSSLAIIVFSAIYNIPRWFEYRAVPSINCTTGVVTGYTINETDFRQSEVFVTFYINWAYLIFMYIIPFTILLYFNVAIYQKTRIHRAIRTTLSPTMAQTNTSNMSSEDLQLATMLFGIVITFITCNLLAIIINLLESIGRDDLLYNLIPINNFTLVLGCSTNFIFYCVYGTEFRRHVRRTLVFRSRQNSSGSTRSELWSEKDTSSIYGRKQRLESIQIPPRNTASGGLDRSRSNSNYSNTYNNNGNNGNSAAQSKTGGSRPHPTIEEISSGHDASPGGRSRDSRTTVITMVSTTDET